MDYAHVAGAILRRGREASGMTQQQLCDWLNERMDALGRTQQVARSSLSLWERGVIGGPAVILVAVVHLSGKSYEELAAGITGEGAPDRMAKLEDELTALRRYVEGAVAEFVRRVPDKDPGQSPRS